MTTRICLNCNRRPIKEHGNAKWCIKCSIAFIHRPKSTLTSQQINTAKRLIGKKPRGEIAKQLGVNVSNLKRAFRGVSLAYYNIWKRQPNLVKDICKFYEKNGAVKTRRMYPSANLRSVLERYKWYKPRTVKFTKEDFEKCIKFAGLIPSETQARILNRPNAFAGSIKSLWCKRIKSHQSGLHGLTQVNRDHLVLKSCPQITTRFGSSPRSHKLSLWVDVENHLKPDCPEFIVSAVKTLADFQRWVFHPNNPRKEILKILRYK